MPEELLRPGGFELQTWVATYLWDHQYAPSIREIQQFLGCGSTSTANLWLKDYQRNGFIDWLPGQARTYHIPRP